MSTTHGVFFNMRKIPVTFLMAELPEDEKALALKVDEYAAAGVKHIVLSSQMILNIMKDYTLADRYRKIFNAAGLDFMDAHSPFGGVLDMNCPDQRFRPQMLLRHRMAILIAASLGVNTITIHPGSDRFFPEIPLTNHLDLMRDSIARLLPEAEKAGVTICIENSMSRAACPRAVTMLKSEFCSPYLGLCYDSGHAHQLDAGRHSPGGTIWKFWQTVGIDEPEWDSRALERMLPEMVNCHLHDNDGSDDTHSIPGAGTLDWGKTVPALLQAPKLRSIQCEVLTEPRYTIEQVYNKFAEMFNL